jgi:hypothetical protein
VAVAAEVVAAMVAAAVAVAVAVVANAINFEKPMAGAAS